MRPKTPPEYVEAYVNASVVKANLPGYKLLILGIMAGAFVAIGAASASAASHGISNVGIAKSLAGIVFPIGMMMIVFVGGELFTGDTMMIMGVFHKRFSYVKYFKTLACVYLSNMIGALIVAVFVVYSGQLKYSSGALGAYTIKVAVDKVNGEFVSLFFSGILCNVLVCVAVLMSMAAKDAAGKVFGFLFPIFAFVIGGYEHCVANMYYIPAGIFAASNDAYATAAEAAYGYTAAQLEALNWENFLLNNLIPVTLGNIVGGMVFVGIPLYVIHSAKLRLEMPVPAKSSKALFFIGKQHTVSAAE